MDKEPLFPRLLRAYVEKEWKMYGEYMEKKILLWKSMWEMLQTLIVPTHSQFLSKKHGRFFSRI